MPKILVVDDDHALTRALSVRLSASGFEVVTAHSAQEASHVAVRERPDLILLDVDLPHFSGLELHECLRFAGRLRDVPVIYLSGNDSLTNRAVAFQQGARAFLPKPYDSQQLLRTIRDVLTRRTRAAEPCGDSVQEEGEHVHAHRACG